MKTIIFSGQKWIIKSGNGKGPGSNNWNENNVYVDRAGNLHLRINKIDDKWYCAEIITEDPIRYGEYDFYVSSNVELSDKNIVVGLFIYENDKKEIDIEFHNKETLYTVQPHKPKRFKMNLQGDYSTHTILFYSDLISFKSYHGHGFRSDLLIKKWISPTDILVNPKTAHLHINFWLKNGKPPKKEAELIIKKVVHSNHDSHS